MKEIVKSIPSFSILMYIVSEAKLDNMNSQISTLPASVKSPSNIYPTYQKSDANRWGGRRTNRQSNSVSVGNSFGHP